MNKITVKTVTVSTSAEHDDIEVSAIVHDDCTLKVLFEFEAVELELCRDKIMTVDQIGSENSYFTFLADDGEVYHGFCKNYAECVYDLFR